MSKHTSEPWAYGHTHGNTLIVQQGEDPTYCPTFIAATGMPGKAFPANGTANAARIVACVNACQGMTDPAAEITALREAVKLLGDDLRRVGCAYVKELHGNNSVPDVGDYIGRAVLSNPIAAAAVRGGES